MRTLVRIHDDAYGTGFTCDDGSRLTLSADITITCDGFRDINILQRIDPDPVTTIFFITREALWINLLVDIPNSVHFIRLMGIPEPDLERMKNIINKFTKRQSVLQ